MIYFNEIGINLTAGDIQIKVGSCTSNGVTEETIIVCSHSVAKQLAIGLTEAIKDLELAIEYEITPVREIMKTIRSNGG